MRTAAAIFIGSMAALAVLATPVLAKTADIRKTDDKSTAAEAPCHAYEETPGGEWKPVPCQELGSEARSQQRPATANTDNATH